MKGRLKTLLGLICAVVIIVGAPVKAEEEMYPNEVDYSTYGKK